jgi:DNA-binding transcriptional ArsR family regulator
MMAENLEPAAVPSRAQSTAEAKWGSALDAGFQSVPNVLIQSHRKLGLDPLDVLILLNLNMHWWTATDLPFPRASLLAERIGITRRTIERRLVKLQKAKLIERLPTEYRGNSTIRRFRMTGLVNELTRLAQESVAERRRPARSRPEGLE